MPDVILRYKGQPDSLRVTLIRAWKRNDPQLANCPIVSASAGDKEMYRNVVYRIFNANADLDAVYMVRAHGPAFFVYRKGQRHFEVSGDKRYPYAMGAELEVIKI